MFHTVLKIAVECVNEAFVAGEGFKGNGVDKICGILGHEYLYIGVQFFEHTDKIGDFIGSNTAGNSQYNSFSG